MKQLVLALVLAAVWAGLAPAQGAGLSDVVDNPAPPAVPGGSTTAPVSGPLAVVEPMSLRERISQLMFVSLEGSRTPHSGDLALLKSYTPGGVVLPPMLKPNTVPQYITALRGLPMETRFQIPFFIAADMYALSKHLFSADMFPPMPSLMSLAAADHPDANDSLASMLTEQLTVLGINTHLGPTLELAPVLPEARGTVQCFGSDPEHVWTTAAPVYEALGEAGVIAIATGFPGGGLNRTDKSPAVLITPRDALASQDILPYREAVAAGVPMVHVGNTLVPTIDPGNLPASLSSAVMRDLLRGQLGFEGVIVAGPMDTNDIAIAHDPTRAAIMALRAGADMILWNSAGQRIPKTVDEIALAVERGELSEDAINAALLRVMAVKERHGLMARARPVEMQAEKMAKRKTYPRQAYLIERSSVTLVQNQGNALPFTTLASLPVGVTGTVGVGELHEALEKKLKKVVQQPIMTARHGGRIYDFEISRLTRNMLSLRTVVVVLDSNLEGSGPTELIQTIKKGGAKVVVVLLGYPRNLHRLAMADAIVLAYADTNASIAQTMTAVSDALLAEGPVKLLRPKGDLQVAVGQSTTFNVLDIARAPAGTLPVTLTPPYVAGLSVPYDPGYLIRRVRWDFGDGKRSSKPVAEKVFNAPGRYPVTVTVTDRKKATVSETYHVVVGQPAATEPGA